MKKMIMTLMLAIAGSVWTMSEAACYPQEPDNLALHYITVSGTIQDLGTPCEEGEVCPPCLTPAIVTSDKTYYLTTSNQAVQNFLEHMETSPVPSIYSLPLQAKASGTPFTRGNYNFLIVSDINSLYVQYFSDRLDLPSLCDEWNVLEFRSHMESIPDEYNMRHYRLTTDTVIGEQRYIQLYKDQTYKGAMREGNNRDIYYIPAYTTHEYLLYAFNAQVGDQLLDLWVGSTMDKVFSKEYFPSGVNATVEEIIDTTPRRFVLSISYVTTEEGVENYPYYFEWIEGIGLGSAPDGATNPLPYPGGFSSFLLCAYKNGEQMYVSESGEKYGCEYNVEQPRLPSLCDEWNILEIAYPDGYEKFHTVKQRLTTDTIIGANQYVKLEQSGKYLGALREGTDKDIYYIPANSTREYLLYAFNAKVGDVFENAWMGRIESWAPDGYIVSVENIYGNSPRIYELKVQFGHEINDTPERDYAEWTRTWIEGIGFTEGPSGSTCPFPCEGDYNEQLLCAYKNGEQVYVSESGEKYGCYYDGGTQQDRLPSLCDEWNVLMDSGFELGPVYGEIWTNGFKVQGDT
ncbi:MAG: hypothetical protein IJ915_00450, partial [Paludibacteraceae bacterium]|nr:hypothetical protein [Paludibacteraceae bacterium]